VGGAERLLVDIARGLDPQRFTSIACCIQDRGELAAELEAAGVVVHCLDRMRTKRFDWGAVSALKRLLRSERIDVVHCHLYHANLYGRIAAWLAGVPAVVSIHNTYTRVKLHRRLLNRLLARVTARIIAVSDETRRDILRYDGVPEDKVVTIYNGIDVQRVASALTRAQARQRLGIDEQSIAIGCVGRLEEQKGHRFLLEALARLNDAPRGPARFRVVLVGDGRLRAELEQRAAGLGVAAWTLFLGTRHDVPEILKALDICVMPSLWEGLSVAMLEAMAASLPLVISDVSGVSQVIGDNEYGLKVPVGDVSELARAIAGLADAPERRAALGAAARRRVVDAFGAAAMIAAISRTYEEAARALPVR
jgi:glycosyltransferase involved in cell wall biosynthesis